MGRTRKKLLFAILMICSVIVFSSCVDSELEEAHTVYEDEQLEDYGNEKEDEDIGEIQDETDDVVEENHYMAEVLSNDYIIIHQYRGITIPRFGQAEIDMDEHIDHHIQNELSQQITINDDGEMVMPELTDEWVQENSRNSTTVEEYREEIRELLEIRFKRSALSLRGSAAFNALREHIEVIELPQWVVEEEIARLKDETKAMAELHGMEFEEFLQQFLRWDEEMYIENTTELAKEAVISKMVIDLIVERENLHLSAEEMMEQIENLAVLYEMDSMEDFIAQMGSIEQVHRMVMSSLVADLILEYGVEIGSQ